MPIPGKDSLAYCAPQSKRGGTNLGRSMATRILVLNAGSSSLKFSVYKAASPPVTEFAGWVSPMGPRARVRIVDRTGAVVQDTPVAAANVREAVSWVGQWYRLEFHPSAPDAVAHRVVHGGRQFTEATIVTPEVRAQLAGLARWAPLHQPLSLDGIDVTRQLWPTSLQVAAFDTAFHATLPARARLFALPRRFAEEGLVRYGFHGLSFASVVRQLLAAAPELYERKWVVAHLGSGSSLCAIEKGHSVATTMGLTPLDGVPMASRCGSIDPGVLLDLLRHGGLSVDALEHLLYYESGLRGLSGISGDLRELEASSDPRAHEAIEIFADRVGQAIAALAAAVGGLDVLVFCGGIGENSASMRERICAKLHWLGLELDRNANRQPCGPISMSSSRVATWVIASDENGEIARQTCALLARTKSGSTTS